MEIIGGYGIISKNILRSRQLTAEAKAIYCYLCSFADESGNCFPSVGLMREELGMSENRFNKHMKQLLKYGIVKRERLRDSNRFGSYFYTINHNAKIEGIYFEGVENKGIVFECLQNTGNNIISNNNTSINNTIINNSDALHRICYLLNEGNAKESYKGRIKPDSQMTRIYFDELKRKGVSEEEMLRVAEVQAKHGFKGSMMDFCNLWDKYGRYKALKNR